MKKMLLILCLFFAVFVSQNARAIHLGKSDDGKVLPYSKKLEHKLDQPVNDACKDGSFFMNLGPTGIRAIIEEDEPKAFKVKFVFQDAKSPAKGLINPGDFIVGANGKEFEKPHKFDRKKGGRGWPGPPFELAHFIEDSQGADGKLTLIVLEGGSRNKRKNVALQLKPVGRFSKTWPWNCPRSDALRKQLTDFLLENNTGRLHMRVQQTLALYASGDKRAVPIFKSLAEEIAKDRDNPASGGMVTWGWGYKGIVLGEYCNIYKDSSRVKAAVEALNECYEVGMNYEQGIYSHRPFPFNQQRLAAKGDRPYAHMAGIAGLAMLAQSTFKANGLPYSDLAYNRIHTSYLGSAGTRSDAGIAYGFESNGGNKGEWDSACIELKDPSSPCRSKKGIGYLCPTGMKNVGDYKVQTWEREQNGEWVKKSAEDFPWLTKETDKLLVFEVGDHRAPKAQRRLVLRPRVLPEPAKPYKTTPGGGEHVLPVGLGALAHFIGNKGNTSWNYLGKHMATCCATSPKSLWDGHAEAAMHAFWGALGAFLADESDLRSWLDYTKTWIILSESHDGQGLIEQPFGCQRNSTCSIDRNRTAYTHVALMILSVPNRNLLITGADFAQPAKSSAATPASSSAAARLVPAAKAASETRKPARDARVISAANRGKLDDILKSILVKLSSANALGAKPVRLAGIRQDVILKSVGENGVLAIERASDRAKGEIKWSDLPDWDRMTLAALVAALRPDSGDAQAMAGVYLEILGNVDSADKYFEKAGKDSVKKLTPLFD